MGDNDTPKPHPLSPEVRAGLLDVLRNTDRQGEAVLDYLERTLPWRCVFERPAPRLVTELIGELAGEEGLRIISPNAEEAWIKEIVERSQPDPAEKPGLYSIWEAGFRYYRQTEQTESWLREDEFPDQPEKLESALAAYRQGGIPALRRWFSGVAQ